MVNFHLDVKIVTSSIVLTSMLPQVVTTLKPMYPRELRTTIGVAGRLIPWGGLDGGGLWDIVKLALNLL